MAVSWVERSGTFGASPRTLNKPTGLATGDILFGFIGTALLAGTPPTAPSIDGSWTDITALAIVTDPDSRQLHGKFFYRWVDGTEPASWTVTGPAGADTIGVLWAWRGATSLLAVGGQGNTANPRQGPSLTAYSPDAKLVWMSYAYRSHSSPSWTPPAGMTEHVDDYNYPAKTAASKDWDRQSGATGVQDGTWNNGNAPSFTMTAILGERPGGWVFGNVAHA